MRTRMTYVKRKFYPDPTPKFLHKRRLEENNIRTGNAQVDGDGESVPWQVNADIISKMKEE